MEEESGTCEHVLQDEGEWARAGGPQLDVSTWVQKDLKQREGKRNKHGNQVGFMNVCYNTD